MTTALPTLAQQVLTDGDLFRRITAFQRGLAMPLFVFWRKYSPGDEPLRLTTTTAAALVETLTAHGTPELFDLAKRATFSTSDAGWSHQETPELRKMSFAQVAWSALQQNRADIVQWALASKSSKPPRDREGVWRDVLMRYAEDEDPRMAGVLKTFAPLKPRKLNALVYNACYRVKEENLLRWLRWLAKAFPDVEIPRDTVRLATDRGDLPLLQFLHAQGLTTCEPSAFQRVLAARQYDMLAFLLDHYLGSLTEWCARDLVVASDPEVQQLTVRFSEQLQTGYARAISSAVNDSELACVQEWAARGLISPRWPISIDLAAANGNIRTVRFLHEQGIATATTAAMDQAAKNRHWELVKFLHENRTEGCTTLAMDAAIEQNQFKWVTFLHENRTEGYSLHATEKAAGLQSLEILRFLHSHTNAVFTPAVMDKAAALGNLSMVKFLHENRSEGCTTDAMDHAAANGHLRVVEFLHNHRHEGCSFAAVREALQKALFPVVCFLFDKYRELFAPDALNQALVTSAVRFALKHGRSNVVEFLFEHFPHLFTRELIHDLLLHGAFDIYMMLQRQYPDNTDETVASVLYEAGRSMELQTIRFIVDELGRRDLAYRAMDGAASNLRCGTHWLRAVYSITGPDSCRLSAVLLAIDGMHYSSLADPVTYVVRVCCEPNAQQVVVEASKAYYLPHLTDKLTNLDQTADDEEYDEKPLDPFLLDPRVKAWAIDRLFECQPETRDPHRRLHMDDPNQHTLTPLTWAIQAVYKHDVSLLEVIRETSPRRWYTHASHSDMMNAETVADMLSFEGARAAAVRIGDLPVLHWLMEKIDLPVEPTLLQEAVYYDQREIALWLVEHHPAACATVHPHPSFTPFSTNMTEDQLDWLEANAPVREALDFACIVVSLIEWGDNNAVRRVHAWYPGLLRSVPGLIKVARRWGNEEMVMFLDEVGYEAIG